MTLSYPSSSLKVITTALVLLDAVLSANFLPLVEHGTGQSKKKKTCSLVSAGLPFRDPVPCSLLLFLDVHMAGYFSLEKSNMPRFKLTIEENGLAIVCRIGTH